MVSYLRSCQRLAEKYLLCRLLSVNEVHQYTADCGDKVPCMLFLLSNIFYTLVLVSWVVESHGRAWVCLGERHGGFGEQKYQQRHREPLKSQTYLHPKWRLFPFILHYFWPESHYEGKSLPFATLTFPKARLYSHGCAGRPVCASPSFKLYMVSGILSYWQVQNVALPVALFMLLFGTFTVGSKFYCPVLVWVPNYHLFRALVKSSAVYRE